MIGREAFDTPEQHLVDLTGMSLADAHDGDANAAAETFFLSQDNDVEVDDENVEDSTTTVCFLRASREHATSDRVAAD